MKLEFQKFSGDDHSRKIWYLDLCYTQRYCTHIYFFVILLFITFIYFWEVGRYWSVDARCDWQIRKLGPVSRNYLMTNICQNLSEDLSWLFYETFIYLMIIIRLLEILHNIQIHVLRLKLNQGGCVFFNKK